MNVLYVVADSPREYNSARWRCDMPLEALNRTREHRGMKTGIGDWVDGRSDTACLWADVIVLQRNAVAGALHAMTKWQARGKPVILDLDDGYEYMPQSVLSAQFWINNQSSQDGKLSDLGFTPLKHLTIGVKLARAVTAPSPVIVGDRLALNDRARLVPNYPEAARYLEAAARKLTSERVVLGWGGGGSHLHSFLDSGVIPAFGRILEKRSQVDLLIMGPRELVERLRRQFPRYAARIHGDGWTDYNEWPDRLARLDVGVAPLVGLYDLRRSWIKGLEYALTGIPWVGTDYGAEPQPYSAFKPHLVRNQAKLWEARLTEIIDDLPEARRQMRIEQAWAAEQDIDRNIHQIVNAYSVV